MNKSLGFHSGKRPRFTQHGAILFWFCIAGLVRAETTVKVESPKDAQDSRIYWAVQQNGRIAANGSFVAASGTDNSFAVDCASGHALLLITLNRDGFESFRPSFGDLFQRIELNTADHGGAVQVRAKNWQVRSSDKPGSALTIHYHRFDGDYENAGIWTWDEHSQRMPAEQEIFNVGRDAFGLVFQLDTAEYGKPGEKIGLLPRMRSSWEFKDGGDRFWSSEMGQDVYIVQGRGEVYTEAPGVSPKLVGVSLDSTTEIRVSLSHRLPVVDFQPERFTISADGGSAPQIVSVSHEADGNGKSNVFRLQLAKPLKLTRRSHELTVAGFAPMRIRMGSLLLNDERFVDAEAKLGAEYAPTGTTFRVFSPLADQVEVVVAEVHRGGPRTAGHPMTKSKRGVWTATVKGDLAGKFYAYRLTGADLDPDREVTDIYATCTTGPGGRGLIVDLDKTDPPEFDPSNYVRCDSATDAIIYEMHVRDMTIHPDAGIRHGGKFLGLTEPGTRLAGDSSVTTALDHLVELGATHVQIMPIQDFDNSEEDDGSYNWGYMPICFNSPDGWYATKQVGPERITEFKRLVQALHQRGIGVIMDVVYNHAAIDAGFEHLVPGYYFRRRADGSLWNGSGCGNEFASEHPMARKFMLDSLEFWVKEYGVDGFRFDLMGLHDLETMQLIDKRLREINPSVLLLGEPWTGGATGLDRVTDKARIAGSGVVAFNDHFRDAIKGHRDGGASGFIQTGGQVEKIRHGIRGAIDDWAGQPTDCVTYCACHDNLTTWDKLLQSMPAAPVELQERMQRFAGFLVLTSQGVAFIHSGQEFCRSKGGSNNSYNLPDSVNQIDWSLKRTHRQVFDYYRGLIALRKAHPAFRLGTTKQIRQRLAIRKQVPSSKCVAYTLDTRGLAGETSDQLLILLNGDSTAQSFALPEGQWRVLVDANRAGTEVLAKLQGTVSLPPHSGMVLDR